MLRLLILIGCCLFITKADERSSVVAAIRNAFTSVTGNCATTQNPCPVGQTCCNVSSTYGCCDLPNATCCSDQKHCCPVGYICDSEHRLCKPKLSNKEVSFKMRKIDGSKMMKNSEHSYKLRDIKCPDDISYCPSNSTCCLVNTGQYGCCPYVKANCCKDKIHCCPQGYTCDLSEGTCKKGDLEYKALEKSFMRRLGDVACPDGKSFCPDGSTCCKMATGQYGCCPFPMAVCCKDFVHCCPRGYTCDVSQASCIKEGTAIKALSKIAIESYGNVICPDGESYCPDGNTCCILAIGKYGCCPVPNAVCCSDKVHCCPSGYTCGGSGTCIKGSVTIEAMSKTPAIHYGNVICPDGQSECPDGSTCCKLSSGEYGCCPTPKAVCCSDMIHCCPNGYTCDVSTGSCVQGDVAVKAMSKITAMRYGNVICPDGQSYCPDGNTCCILAIGKYGCCPVPNAVCCSDKVHCCPSGYTCGSSGTCIKGSATIEAMSKMPAIRYGNVICPDGQSECPDGSTCCILASGGYGCCPTPKAVCCRDKVHCCPSGYTCDVSTGSCTRNGVTIKAMSKTAPIRAGDIMCQDGMSHCPDGSTCCELPTGQYGCCPTPKAVCCSDKVHCCPDGYTCDVTQGSCTRQGLTTRAMSKIIAVSTSSGNVPCPDGQSYCPDGSTCCILATGQYGCCPFPNAVCCVDMIHCCPSGFTCDGSGSCIRNGVIMKAMSKVTVMSHLQPKVKTDETLAFKSQSQMIEKLFWHKSKLNCVMCPDDSECPDFNTCCQLPNGAYGCCGFPSAVCCSDHTHCCQHGYTCDVAHGVCTNNEKENKPMMRMSLKSERPRKLPSSTFDEM